MKQSRTIIASLRVFSLTLVGVLFGASAFAQTIPGNTSEDVSGGNSSTKLVNPLKDIDDLGDLLAAVLDVVINIGFIFLTLMIVYVGFKFVMAQGKDEELKNARAALLWTVIGGLILLGAKAISEFVQATGAALGS